MEKENIHIDWEVISKSFRGELSGEERERLESWLAVSSRHRDFYRRALEGGETDVTVGVDRDVLAAKKDELMRRVRVMTGNVKPRRSLRCVWYAAAVILPCGDCCRDVGEYGRTGEKRGDCPAGATG